MTKKSPKNLKQAMEDDRWLVKNIYNKGSKRCRVDVKPRFNRNNLKSIESYWVTSAYVKRMYPRMYDRF